MICHNFQALLRYHLKSGNCETSGQEMHILAFFLCPSRSCGQVPDQVTHETTERIIIVGNIVTVSTDTQEKEEKFRKWAVDEISICPSNTLGNDQVQVDHLRFQDGHHASLLRLAQLVVLACAISDYCATYHIMLSNCYWFCYVASEVLKKRFQVDNTRY